MRFIRLLKHDLATEAGHWVRESIVTREQAQTILARYGTSLNQSERKGFGYYVLLALAALSCGKAVLLLVSHNWADLPRTARILALIIATLGLNGGGFVAWSRGREHLARVLFIVGSMMYGATIFLIAQIYHLQLDFPPGVLWWAIGIIPLAIASRSITVSLIATVLSTLWVIISYSTPHLSWWVRAQIKIPYLPLEVYFIYPLLIGSIFYFCFFLRRSLSVFLAAIISTIVVAEIVLTNFVAHDVGVVHVVFTIGIQLLLYSLGGFLERVAKNDNVVDYGVVLRLWAMRFAVITLFVFSFDETWRDFLRAAVTKQGLLSSTALCLLIPTAILAGLTPYLARRSGALFGTHIPQVIVFSIVYAAIVILAPLASNGTRLFDSSTAVTVGQLSSNLMLLMVGVWYIAKGINVERSTEVIFGTIIILVLALVRYSDLIGGYLGTSAIFLVEAAIMFGVARAMRRFSSESMEV